MEHSDMILLLDRKYATVYKGGTPVPCPNEGKPAKLQAGVKTEHGSLGVHKSGQFLVCGICNYQYPVGAV